MQILLRGAAAALDHPAEKAHQGADDFQAEFNPDQAAQAFAGVDIVGIDFSNSIHRVARHVFRAWDHSRRNCGGAYA
jgi:hypothetical protein